MSRAMVRSRKHRRTAYDRMAADTQDTSSASAPKPKAAGIKTGQNC